MAEAMKRPVLTMPPEESAALTQAYQAAKVILEYGTGGSTVVAADLAGRDVFSVESSAEWLAMMQGWFKANPPKARLQLHHGDIGKTRQWGYPVDNKHVGRWVGYPVSVWDRADFVHPDVVLIDGRFRLACALTALFRISRPVTVLIDDYTGRPRYAQIETLVGAPEMIGRMAKFEFTPQPMPPVHLGWIMAAFANPN
jgi:SAM-dependent methyltransferase